MDLSTTYLGFPLAHPVIPGAGPLTDNLDQAKQLEDAGAPMLTLPSLFEEQIIEEELAIGTALESHSHAYGEALGYFPEPANLKPASESYLHHLQRVKQSVAVPVVASLNGTTQGGWTKYARLMEEAGADALELNLYEIATEPAWTGQDVEQKELRLVKQVREAVSIPVAVKLSPFYSSIPNFATRLDKLEVDALVLFNRFYQPDVDVEQLDLVRVNLSSPSELTLRLRWVGVLFGQLSASLAVTGGAHSATDVVKAVMCGADAVQVVSSLLRRGPERLASLVAELAEWLEQHEYDSLQQMRGSMSLLRTDNPAAYTRANYIKLVHSWEPRQPK